MKKFTFSLLLFLYCFSSITSQVIVTDSYYFLMDEIDDNTVESLLESVRSAVKEYDQFADLLDDQNFTVSQESINQFKDLFAQNAKVYNDISKSTSTINYSDYASQVSDYLENEGVNYDIFGAMIEGISYDSAGYYEVDVLTRKYLYNGLDEYRRPFYCENGRTFNLRFTYVIPEDDLEEAKILKIYGNLLSECQDKALLINPEFSISRGNISSDPNLFNQNNLSSLHSDFIARPTFSLGVRLEKALNVKNNILFSTGMFYQFQPITTTWGGSYRYEVEGDENRIFNNIVQLNNGLEKGRVGMMKIPLGVKIRLVDWSPLYLFARPSIISNFILHDQLEFEGAIFSIQQYSDNEIILPQFIEDQIVVETINYTSNLNHKKIFFSVGLDVVAEYAITKNMAIELGVNYTRGITSITKQSDLQDRYYPDQNEAISSSYINEYFTSTLFNSIGLQLGVVFKQ